MATKTQPEIHNAECRAQHFGPWLIEESWLRNAVEAVRNGTMKAEAVDPVERMDRAGYRIANGVAVIPIVGQIMKGDSKFGGTSSVRTRQVIRQAAKDDAVHSILLHIDSPGGTVAGTADLANEVANARATKPVHAHIDDLGASAAYWIASQASTVSANETAMIGSIGTLGVLVDSSAGAEKAGIKVHVISTGPFKGTGVSGAPITEEQINDYQQLVNDLNEHFLSAVSKGRGLTIAQVRNLADGRVHVAEKAKQLGLIDVVQSFDSALATAANPTEQTIMSKTNAAPKAATPEDGETHDDFIARCKSEGGTDESCEMDWENADAKKKSASATAAAKIAELKAAFPNHAGFVIDQIGANATMLQAKAAFADVLATENADLKSKNAELQGRLDKLANAGHAGVTGVVNNASASASGEKPVDTNDPKAVASAEWDADASLSKKFSSKDRYVAVREAELTGKLKRNSR